MLGCLLTLSLGEAGRSERDFCEVLPACLSGEDAFDFEIGIEMADKQLTAEQKKELSDAVVSLAGLFGDEYLAEHLADRIRQFSGNFDHLEASLGALMVGRLVGWETLRIIHSNATWNRMEKILGLKFRESLPWAGEDAPPLLEKRGVYAKKSYALRFVDKVGSFRAVFQGETDITKKQRRIME